jgi:hypothetical protein
VDLGQETFVSRRKEVYASKAHVGLGALEAGKFASNNRPKTEPRQDPGDQLGILWEMFRDQSAKSAS